MPEALDVEQFHKVDIEIIRMTISAFVNILFTIGFQTRKDYLLESALTKSN